MPLPPVDMHPGCCAVRLAGVAMDVYEMEGPLFFKDYTRYAAK